MHKQTAIFVTFISAFIFGCGDRNGDFDPNAIIPAPAPGNSQPNINAPTDSSTNTATINLVATANDADGDPLHITWSLANGPAQHILINDPDNNGTADLTFPCNGIYTINVQVDDGNGGVNSDSVNITVNVVNNFNIDGNVSDGAIGLQTGTENVSSLLHWNLLASNTQILTTNTDMNGDFSFNALIGSPSDFSLNVSSSP